MSMAVVSKTVYKETPPAGLAVSVHMGNPQVIAGVRT